MGLRVSGRSLGRVRTVRDPKTQIAPRCPSRLVLTSGGPREMRFDSTRDRRLIFWSQPLLLNRDFAEFIFLNLLFTVDSGSYRTRWPRRIPLDPPCLSKAAFVENTRCSGRIIEAHAFSAFASLGWIGFLLPHWNHSVTSTVDRTIK